MGNTSPAFNCYLVYYNIKKWDVLDSRVKNYIYECGMIIYETRSFIYLVMDLTWEDEIINMFEFLLKQKPKKIYYYLYDSYHKTKKITQT